MLKKVSVIIVTFNAENTLDNAIQSILNQTYENVECLIIDGASTDNTVNIIEKYWINYISEPDSGIYDAMNKGWKLAQGEWILYLGADDELLTNGIEILIKNCDNCDVVYGNTILKFPSGKTKKQYSQNIDVITKKDFCCHQSLMMKKKIIEKLGGFNLNYKIASDSELLLRAYLNGYSFKQISNFISRFFVGGISTDNITILFERVQYLKENNVKINYLYFVYRLFRTKLVSLKHNIFDRKRYFSTFVCLLLDLYAKHRARIASLRKIYLSDTKCYHTDNDK
jgi:glycosyltransferase involved in cell wall biosynthesis